MLIASPSHADQSFERCRTELELWLANRAGKPWHVAKAIMCFGPDRDGGRDPRAAGVIFTTGPTYYGLGIRFEVQRCFEGHGLATAGLRLFRVEYWEKPRSASVEEVILPPRFFASREMWGNWQAAKRRVRVVEHLIAMTDRRDGHAQRVLEKLELEPEDEEEMLPCLVYRLRMTAE